MRLRSVAILVPTALLVASLAWAQFRRVGDTSLDAHLARPESYDGRFHYCRAVYRPNPRGDGGSWLTDYPLADIDLSIRVSELTKIAVVSGVEWSTRALTATPPASFTSTELKVR